MEEPSIATEVRGNELRSNGMALSGVELSSDGKAKQRSVQKRNSYEIQSKGKVTNSIATEERRVDKHRNGNEKHFDVQNKYKKER